MDGEVSTLIADIQSLLQQIAQVAGNSESADGSVEMAAEEKPMEESAPAQDDAGKLEAIKKILKAMAEGEPDADEDDKKDKVEKSDEGPNASDDAEGRIDDGQGKSNEENVKEVAKALAKLMGVKVQKSQPVKKSNDMDKVLKALGQISDRLEVHEKSLVEIFEGLGVADEIKKSAKIETVEKARPKNDPAEIKKSVEYIREMLGVEKPAQDKSVSGRFDLKKALCDNDGLALTAMLSTKQK